MRKVILFAALLTAAAVSAAALASGDSRRPTSATTPTSQALATWLSQARLATAKYATNLPAAKADGYQILTKMIPDMGYHFINPKVKGFSPAHPPILVYEKHGTTWQLGALEWVYTSKPKTPPLPGATYGAFGAACHYADGTVVPATVQTGCPKRAPGSGAAFGFWHPNLITMHVWLWYPNPSGLFSGTNPLARPYN
jgi:hypothetical protein